MLLQFLFSFCSTAGFSVLFNIPKHAIIKSSVVGAAGWITFLYCNHQSHSLVLSSFIGTCTVALLSEIFARVFKEAVTVFIIPGIIPIVPGSQMYYTMLALIEKNMDKFASSGRETIFIAGSIAVAILMISSITRMIFQFKTSILQKHS